VREYRQREYDKLEKFYLALADKDGLAMANWETYRSLKRAKAICVGMMDVLDIIASGANPAQAVLATLDFEQEDWLRFFFGRNKVILAAKEYRKTGDAKSLQEALDSLDILENTIA
jgi:hypothetical protein